jgi:hypothetical protein
MTAAAPPAKDRVTLLRDPLVLGGAGLASLAVLHVRDPHDSGSYGFCPFLLLTGHPCPGCGGLRAMNNLTNGDLLGAASSNLMAVVLLGLLVGAWVVWIVRRWRRQDVPLPGMTATSVIVVALAFAVFGIVRNTPWGAWLAP